MIMYLQLFGGRGAGLPKGSSGGGGKTYIKKMAQAQGLID